MAAWALMIGQSKQYNPSGEWLGMSMQLFKDHGAQKFAKQLMATKVPAL